MRTGLLAAFVLAAPRWIPARDSARIHVYAQRLADARSWLPISRGEATVAQLKREKFSAMVVAAGRHALSAENGLPASIGLTSAQSKALTTTAIQEAR